MSKPDHSLGFFGDDLPSLRDLPIDDHLRELLLRALDTELEKRYQRQVNAERFLERVTSPGRYVKLAKWLRYLHFRHPALGDVPDFSTTLAYALSDSLDSKEFLDYTSFMGYSYWANDLEKADLTALSQSIVSLPNKLLRAIAEEWYRHVLRNALLQGAETAPDVERYAPGDALRASLYPTTFLEEMTSGRVRLVQSAQLSPSIGVLLIGPRASTLLVSARDRSPNQITAYLLGHFLLSHASKRRFQFRLETKFLNARGKWIAKTHEFSTQVEHDAKDEEAVLAADCLLAPFPPVPTLSARCQRSVMTLREVGVPKHLVQLLFQLREERGIPLLALLQKPTNYIDDPLEIAGPKTESNGVVLDENNQLYLIRKDFTLSLLINGGSK